MRTKGERVAARAAKSTPTGGTVAGGATGASGGGRQRKSARDTAGSGATGGSGEQAARPRHFVLSCMDYRHMDDLAEGLKREFGEVADDYDHAILAGACLGVVQPLYPEWAATFWKHLEIARELHEAITTLVLVEHEACGAYKKFFDEEYPDVLHGAMADLVALKARKLHPDLRVARFIMRRDGNDHVWRLSPLGR
jgi:hypothetical protein